MIELMVDVAQLAEHRIVVPGVVGSRPTIHPMRPSTSILSGRGAIGSALALGARGCQFESGRPDHFLAESLSYHITVSGELCLNYFKIRTFVMHTTFFRL
jgi:hypothetical protein